jgi:hypothetical protein
VTGQRWSVALKSSFGKGTDPSAEVTCVAKSAVDKEYWRPGHRLRSNLPLLMVDSTVT